MENKNKLMTDISKSNMAEIALRSVLGEYIPQRNKSLQEKMISEFRVNGPMLINIVAEIAALDSLEKDIMSRINRGRNADIKLKEIQNAEERNRNED